MDDTVEVLISCAEYECPYEYDWTAVEWTAQTQDGPKTYRLADNTYGDRYAIPREMYERWAAVEEGFQRLQEDIKELKKKPPLLRDGKPYRPYQVQW